MTAPVKLNARLLLLLLAFGLLLIGLNLLRNLNWIQDRRIARFESEMTDAGGRLSGMMQHYFRRGLVAPAELEMSYAALMPHLELGIVCDAGYIVRFSTHLQWVGLPLPETPLSSTATLSAEAKSDMTPRVVLDQARGVITGVFPFYEQYHAQNRGMVMLRFDMKDALRQASSEAMSESAAQASGLLALCMLLWLALDIMVTRRVKELAEYAQAMGSGDEQEAHFAKADELSIVAHSFDTAIKNLRASELRLLEASEAERRRIGADLHDDVCQRMAAAQLKTGVLESALRREGHAQSQLAAAVADELAKAAKVARGFARGLSPVLVQSGHLEDVLDELATTISDSFAVRCEYQARLGDSHLGLWVNTHVYRIIQELATNAAKHARPALILLEVGVTQNRLMLRVENDGIPFERRRSGGIGLDLVAQRVRALGGRWSISPRGGDMGGCIASCEVHLDARHFTDAGPSVV
jgi:signal transduction histidine kinase